MFNYNPLSFIIFILLAFITTVLSNSMYYLFVSFLERLFYKEEGKKKITTPTIILTSISLLCLLMYMVLNLNYHMIIKNGIIDNPPSQIANLSNMIKNTTEFLRFFSVLTIIFLVTDLFKNDKLKIKNNSKLVLAFIIFITYEIFWSRIQVGLNMAINDISRSIGTNVDFIDLYVKITRYIQAIHLLIQSSFYIILSVFILIINNKKIKEIFGLRLMFIAWIILYLLIPIGFFLQKENLLVISSYVCVGVLSVVITLYLFVNYFRKSNRIIIEE